MREKRLKNSTNPRKWQNGDSCVSNPGTRRFRDKAKQSRRLPTTELTPSSLAKHNLNVLSKDDDDEVIPSEGSISTISHSKYSARSSISGLTDCSNMAFHHVQNLWASPNEEHKQICAVLAAVTEAIRSKNGNETETEYFGALVVAIQATTDEETRSAIVFLLNLVMKRVHPTVLQSKFSEVTKILFELLAEYHLSGKTSMLKNLISCLSTLLLNQDISTWSHASTTQIFQSILNFCVHAKPKVRKSAQSGVCSLMKMNQSNENINPSGDIAGRFCLKHLQQHEEENSASTLHVLNLLKIIFRYFDKEFTRRIAEEILNLSRQGTVMMKANCLQTLFSLFDACPSEDNLPSSLNGKILSALYDTQPYTSDSQLAPSWLKVMESAFINLSIIDADLCLALLPKMFSSCMVYILSDSRNTCDCATETMKTLIEKCLHPTLTAIGEETSSEQQNYFQQIFRHVERGMQFKYNTVWASVFKLLELFFETFGKQFHQYFTKCLTTICDLHDVSNFAYMNELEKTVAAAIRSMGPKIVLTAVPLNLLTKGNKSEFARSWLLPLMKDHIQNTELQYFTSDLLPVAAQLHEKGLSCSQNGMALEAKLYETLQLQVWALLPGFCKNPTDLKEAFKNIARILGKALTDRPEIRMVVLLSLRTIILRSLDSDEEAAEIGKYSKNFLPILFNLYTTNADGSGEKLPLSVLETIKVFLKIANEELASSLLQNAMKRVVDPTCSKEKRFAMMDLIAALVTHVDEKSVKAVCDWTLPIITSQESKDQKKAYRILEEICQGRSSGCSEFVLANLDSLKQLLLTSISSAGPASKAPRLSCLTGIVRKVSADQKEFLVSILPEVILCTKAINTRAKTFAFNLLEEIGNCYIFIEKSSKEDSVVSYMKMVMAGLAGSPHMISATLLSINRLAHVYKESLPSHLVDSLLLSGVKLLRSKEREVTKAALALVKAIISLLEKDDLASHSQSLIKSLFAGRKTDRNFLRTQAQFLIEKLIRKLGYEIVRASVPEEYRKFVTNIHKITEKRKKLHDTTDIKETGHSNKQKRDAKKKDDLIDDISSEDEEESILGLPSKTSQPKKSDSWIIEPSHQVVDFLDPQMSTNVSASFPKRKFNNGTKSSGFSMADDGKLVIEEEMKDKSKTEDDEMLTIDDQKNSRKRRRSVGDEDGDEFSYQPGGSGIHRSSANNVSKVVEGVKNMKFGAEYKAKKAGGDMKIKGKPDPFAYIPLSKKVLNKRKRAKQAGQFTGVVKAAKRGVAKMKPRIVQRKRQ